jgi:hypothetical protein
MCMCVCRMGELPALKDKVKEEAREATFQVYEQLVGPNFGLCIIGGSMVARPEDITIKPEIAAIAGRTIIFHIWQPPAATVDGHGAATCASDGIKQTIAQAYGPLHSSAQLFQGHILRWCNGARLTKEAREMVSPALGVFGSVRSEVLPYVLQHVSVYAPFKLLMNGATVTDPPGIKTCNAVHTRMTNEHLQNEVTLPLMLRGRQLLSDHMDMLLEDGGRPGYLRKALDNEIAALLPPLAPQHEQPQPRPQPRLVRQAPLYVQYLERSGVELPDLDTTTEQKITLGVMCKYFKDIQDENAASSARVCADLLRKINANLASHDEDEEDGEAEEDEEDELLASCVAKPPSFACKQLLAPESIAIYPTLLSSMRADPSYALTREMQEAGAGREGGQTPEEVERYMRDTLDVVLEVLVGTPTGELVRMLRDKVHRELVQQQQHVQDVQKALASLQDCGVDLHASLRVLQSSITPDRHAELEQQLAGLYQSMKGFCSKGEGTAHARLQSLLDDSNLSKVAQELVQNEEAEKERLWQELITVCGNWKKLIDANA